MGKMVTVSDACRELGIARSTLERRLKRLSIKTRSIGIDKRERYITDKEVSDIRSAYAAIDERKQSAYAAIGERNISATQLEDKVRALEEEIKRLKQSRIAQLSRDALQGDYDSVEQQNISEYHPRPARLRTIATGSDTMPENWIPLYTLCDIHNIAPSNVSRAIRKGELPKPHIGEWVYHGTSARNGLDPDMQAAILSWHASKAKKDDEEY